MASLWALPEHVSHGMLCDCAQTLQLEGVAGPCVPTGRVWVWPHTKPCSPRVVPAPWPRSDVWGCELAGRPGGLAVALPQHLGRWHILLSPSCPHVFDIGV